MSGSERLGADVERGVVVTRKETIANRVVRLTLRRPDGEIFPAWEPGAHIDLVLRPNMIRQFSLCGDPADRAALQIAVLLEENGRGGSEYIHRLLSAGDRVRMRGPRNHFALVDAAEYLFIAGGIGITPIVRMVFAAERWGIPWRLVYGGRSRGSMAFLDQLTHRFGDRVTICPQDETGLLDLDTLLGTPLPDTAVYCCGPEPLLLAAERHCCHWPDGTLHVERFLPKTDADFGPRRSFGVELAQSGLTLTVPPEKSIVEVAEEAGVFVLCSCQEGTCGTCETRILAGTPEHRDSVLTAGEKAANATMMVCVSRAAGTSRLILDL
jgi:ferredoxin-NADP reductase